MSSRSDTESLRCPADLHAVDWMRGKVTLTVCVDPSDVASLVRMGASVVVEVQT